MQRIFSLNTNSLILRNGFLQESFVCFLVCFFFRRVQSRSWSPPSFLHRTSPLETQPLLVCTIFTIFSAVCCDQFSCCDPHMQSRRLRNIGKEEMITLHCCMRWTNCTNLPHSLPENCTRRRKALIMQTLLTSCGKTPGENGTTTSRRCTFWS